MSKKTHHCNWCIVCGAPCSPKLPMCFVCAGDKAMADRDVLLGRIHDHDQVRQEFKDQPDGE